VDTQNYRTEYACSVISKTPLANQRGKSPIANFPPLSYYLYPRVQAELPLQI